MNFTFSINRAPDFVQLSRGGECDFKGCEYEDDTILAITDNTPLIFALLSNEIRLLIYEMSASK